MVGVTNITLPDSTSTPKIFTDIPLLFANNDENVDATPTTPYIAPLLSQHTFENSVIESEVDKTPLKHAEHTNSDKHGQATKGPAKSNVIKIKEKYANRSRSHSLPGNSLKEFMNFLDSKSDNLPLKRKETASSPDNITQECKIPRPDT